MQLPVGLTQVPVASIMRPEGSTQALQEGLIIQGLMQLLQLLMEETMWRGRVAVLAEFRLGLETTSQMFLLF